MLGAATGQAAVAALEGQRCLLVLAELALGDFAFPDFYAAASGMQPEARWLLLDDPTKAPAVVKALALGVDAYCPTPPDENGLFRLVDRLLQGARAVPLAVLDALRTSFEEASQRALELTMQAEMCAQELEARGQALDMARAEVASLAARPSPEALAAVAGERDAAHARVGELEGALAATRSSLEETARARDEGVAGRIQAEANEQAALQARDQAESLALDAFEGIRSAVEAVQAELSAELNRAMKAEAAAEERAIDAELATDELRNEIARLDAELARAEANREAAEQRFREERLRLVEAQEAGGSAEAYRKMEDMLAEIEGLRRIRAEYEARFGPLDQGPT